MISKQIPSQAFVSPPELVEELKPLGRESRCGEGTVLFRKGDPATGVYILLVGRASLTVTTGNGEAVLARSSGPGRLLGLPGTFLHGTYQLTATIDEDTRLVFVESEKVMVFLRQRTDMRLIVLDILGREVAKMRSSNLQRESPAAPNVTARPCIDLGRIDVARRILC